MSNNNYGTLKDSKPIDYSLADSFIDYDSLNDSNRKLSPSPDNNVEPVEKPVTIVDPIAPASGKSMDLNSIVEQDMSKKARKDDEEETSSSSSSGDEEDEEGPIRSKNELTVLPPVPKVHQTLQPHHEMLPLGVVLSIVGNQVIVHGVEKHNPLNEGSILWLTEARSPLGFVDEIFGQLKYPYYSVRFNSESEVPTGISIDTPVSFVLEFSEYVLFDENLYKKGYDASGPNDEEVTDVEFSDDEKELEFERMQKMTKRNEKTKAKARRFDQPTPQQAKMDMVQPYSFNQNQQNRPPFAPFTYHGGRPNQSLMPSFQPMYSPGFTPAARPYQFHHQPNPFSPYGLPTNGMPWQLQNPAQHVPQMPMPNTFADVAYPHGFVGTSYPLTSIGAQGSHYTGQQFRPNRNLQPATQQFYPAAQQFYPANYSQPPVTFRGNVAAPRQFNQGSSSNRGRGSYSRGGRSHFRGGRGGPQTR